MVRSTKPLLRQLDSLWSAVENGGSGGGGPHVHPIADVTGLQTALDGKQPTGSYSLTSHDHSGVYQPVGDYAAEAHAHVIADVTGLQGELDGKQAAGSYAAASHNHDASYAAVSHGHAIDDVTGLQVALDGKQAAGSYAAASHGHLIADVTGLQTELDGKQASGSYSLTSHNHDGVYATAGHDHTGTYEPAIAAGTTAQYWRGDKTWQTLPAGGGGSGQVVLNFHADGGANCTLTNQANSEQYLANSARNESQFDTTDYTQVRLVAYVITASASVNSPRLYPQYWSGSAWTTIGAGTTASGEAVALTPTGIKATSWIDLPAGAIGDKRFRIGQNGGDGAADPALGNVSLQFK